MALLEVIKYGHPTLRKVAEPYTKEEVDEQFIEDMLDTMYEEDGVGLAAPQVNVSKRLIVCSDRENEYVIFNPKIVATSETRKSDVEGCLSLPGLNAKVERYDKVVVTGKDENWDDIEVKARGLMAVVFQHEIDHLNGIFYTDRADLATLT
jgi:peptide deformylase